ncbi:hypothetical protein ZWY2020_035648 [Hordeum vulgare]|nr:hypothetical protein ZWY2020_035648 [Hordeum vulgare]
MADCSSGPRERGPPARHGKTGEDTAAKSKFRVAVVDYKAALAMNPDHTIYNIQLYLGLCKTLVKLGRGKEAINSCTEALSIDEELVDALAQISLMFHFEIVFKIVVPYYNCRVSTTANPYNRGCNSITRCRDNDPS